jgi:hypothetical protein
MTGAVMPVSTGGAPVTVWVQMSQPCSCPTMGMVPSSVVAESALTHITPVVVQTSSQSARSDDITTACDTVGAKALITKAIMASQVVKRR